MACTNPCSAPHCSTIGAWLSQQCKAQLKNPGECILACDMSTGQCCACVCSCAAYGTPVAIPDGATGKAIETFVPGDAVLAGSPAASGAVTWDAQNVAFSEGTGPNGVEPEMMHISYELSGEEQMLVVTPDHVFFRPDGKITRAERLNPGDALVLGDGGTTPVTSVKVRAYKGGIWNIATSTEKPHSLDGHLLTMQGVVCGDYAVQLFFDDLDEMGLTDGNRHPVFGSADYDCGKGAEPLPERAIAEVLAEAGHGDGVHLHTDHDFALALPDGTARNDGFLTEAQAEELQRLSTAGPVIDNAQVSIVEWLLRLHRAFYPGVNFILDWPNPGCNAYTLYLGNEATIVLQGGLVRVDALGWQGLSLVLAQCISRIGADDTLICKAEADYAIVAPLQSVFYQLYPAMIFDAFSQIEATFALIPTKADAPQGSCHETSLECRVSTFRNTIQGQAMPRCAGGSGPDLLQVTGATGHEDRTATVEFDRPLDIASAEELANYTLDPPARLRKARVEGRHEKTVRLTADFRRGVSYTLVVAGVRSATWAAVDPSHDSATFTIPKAT